MNIDIIAINLSIDKKPKKSDCETIFVICNKLERKDPKPTAYRLPATMCANHANQPLMNAFGLGSPFLIHKYPPPASGIADPNSA